LTKLAVRGCFGATLALGVVGVPATSAHAAAFVTLYVSVNVREEPTSKSAKLDVYPAHEAVLGLGWQFGETIRDNGITNNIWIATGKKGGLPWAWVSAVYLKGDAYAGLDPVRDWCGHGI
jgi:hypothetical protein